MPSSEIATDSLAITLLGPMQVRVHGLPLPPFRSRKPLWLLALLTLRPNRPVERAWLAGTLWPDLEQSKAFANLRPVLSELRKALATQGKRLQSPDRHTLVLDLTDAEVDLLRFDAAIASGNVADLEQAVALYRGPLLEGCNEEWVPQEREAREQECLQALQKLGEASLAGGDYAAAADYYQQAVRIDPWREAARHGWMEALSEGRLVIQQTASVLGLREERGRTLLQSVTEHLRQKRLLLVLDNCEHLLEASAQVAAHLLAECGEVRILATSREALGIVGETVWSVPALAVPETQHLPQGQATLLRVLMGYESVQLFVERAQAVQKSFALSGSNAGPVARACQQLEGIPLAIELAAARVRAMSVEQIVSRLGNHLRLLTGGEPHGAVASADVACDAGLVLHTIERSGAFSAAAAVGLCRGLQPGSGGAGV